MAISLSLVVLFGLVLFFLLRSKELGPGGAFTAAGFGFFLASTGAAGPINRLAQTLIQAAQNL
jgi:preprotein translocase subunit SecG